MLMTVDELRKAVIEHGGKIHKTKEYSIVIEFDNPEDELAFTLKYSHCYIVVESECKQK